MNKGSLAVKCKIKPDVVFSFDRRCNSTQALLGLHPLLRVFQGSLTWHSNKDGGSGATEAH